MKDVDFNQDVLMLLINVVDPKLIEKNQDHFVSCHVEID